MITIPRYDNLPTEEELLSESVPRLREIRSSNPDLWFTEPRVPGRLANDALRAVEATPSLFTCTAEADIRAFFAAAGEASTNGKLPEDLEDRLNAVKKRNAPKTHTQMRRHAHRPIEMDIDAIGAFIRNMRQRYGL